MNLEYRMMTLILMMIGIWYRVHCTHGNKRNGNYFLNELYKTDEKIVMIEIEREKERARETGKKKHSSFEVFLSNKCVQLQTLPERTLLIRMGPN